MSNNNLLNSIPIEVLNNNKINIAESNNKKEIVETKQITNPSLFYDFKKSLGLENYTDGSFILYFFLIAFTIEKLNNLFTFVKTLLVLPKQITKTYNFITKEDLLLLDKLDDLMNQLLGLTAADRIAIAKIHNGTYDHTTAHQMKFSMIYEVINDKTKSTKARIQSIPLNYIKDEIMLGSIKDYQRFDRSNLDTMCDLYLDSVGLSAKYYKLLALNKDIYGVIEIQFTNVPDEDFLDNKIVKKRVYKISKDIEDCLQSIILKRTWFQKTFSKLLVNSNPLFK